MVQLEGLIRKMNGSVGDFNFHAEAQAQAESCPNYQHPNYKHPNLISSPKTMIKKFITIVALAATTFMSANAQILYRITSDSQQKPSYIIGTFHLEDGSYLDQIPGARAAIDEVEQVYGEIDINTMTNPDSMAIMQSHLMIENDKTIKDILTPEQFDKLDKYVESIVGTKFSNPLLFQQMGKMKPAALDQALEIVKVLKMKQGQFDQNNVIDNYIQNVAKEKGKKTNGLETLAFQTNLIFDRPIAEMVEELMCTIDNNEFEDKQMQMLIDAYHAQDAEKLMDITLMKMGNRCDVTDEYMDNLLFNRNRNWVKAIPAIVKEHSTLFAVGAGHLGGEKGVVNLLRKAGYKVEGVK